MNINVKPNMLNNFLKTIQDYANRNHTATVVIAFVAMMFMLHMQQHRQEQFLGGVFGGGSKSKTKIDIDNEIINKTLNETFSKQVQSDEVSAAIVQEVRVKAANDVTLGAINMDALVEVDLDSWQKTENAQELKESLSVALDNAIKAETSTKNEGIGGIVSGIFGGGKVKNDVEVKNTVVNETINRISIEQINKCIASGYVNQKIIVESTDGGVEMDAVDFNAVVRAAAKCVSDVITEVVTDVARDISEETGTEVTTKIEDKGLLGGIFGGLFDTGNLLWYGLLGVAALIVLIIIIVVIIAGIIAMFR